MKSSNQVEFAAGLFMLIGIAVLIFLALQATNARGFRVDESYQLTAYFRDIGGLQEGAPVSMAGVQIGRVESITLDDETFEARASLNISKEHDQLPSDTSASILTSGILGEQYIGLEPGGSPEVLEEGDRIVITNSAVVLEQLIGRYLFNSGDGQDQGEQP